MSSGTSGLAASTMRPESHSSCSRGSSTGDRSSASCDQTRSCDGTVRDSVCSGVGSRGRPGRPRIPPYLQDVIATMARANQTWGKERIAAELLLKLGVSVSPRSVRRYMRRLVPSRPRSSSQRGGRLCGTTLARPWRAISSWWSRPRSGSCTCSWYWTSAPGGSCIGTSLNIRRPSRRCSSSGAC
jgi:hypothetical protein